MFNDDPDSLFSNSSGQKSYEFPIPEDDYQAIKAIIVQKLKSRGWKPTEKQHQAMAQSLYNLHVANRSTIWSQKTRDWGRLVTEAEVLIAYNQLISRIQN
jgi:hypothetical protein